VEIGRLKKLHAEQEAVRRRLGHRLCSSYRLSVQAWIREKESLVEMVERNQRIASELQSTLKEGQTDMTTKLSSVRAQVEAREDILARDNQMLREEVARMQKLYAEKEKSAAEIREGLIQEVQRMRQLLQDKDKAASTEREELQAEIDRVRTLLDEKERLALEERRVFQLELSLVQKAAEKKEQSYDTQIKDLQAQLRTISRQKDGLQSPYASLPFSVFFCLFVCFCW